MAFLSSSQQRRGRRGRKYGACGFTKMRRSWEAKVNWNNDRPPSIVFATSFKNDPEGTNEYLHSLN